MHRHTRRQALTYGGLGAAAIAGCAARSDDPKVVTFWTGDPSPNRMTALKQIIDGFERANPGYQVELVPKPSLGVGDATSLITSVRGRTGPDVYLIDRFTCAQYAATGLLTNLSPYVDPGLSSHYVDFAWNEASYLGDVYGLPVDTATNATLYYNIDMLEAAGIDADVLDARYGPPTIDQVMQIAAKISEIGPDGNYTHMGIVPWSGQGFWCAWALSNGAKFYDQGSCELTPTEPAMMRTFAQLREWSRELGYTKTDTFVATYQPPGSPPEQSLFYSGKVAMQVDGNWGLANLKAYAPKLRFGVTYLPVRRAGDPPFSWSGGFAYVIPTGAGNPDGGWKFMKYAAGEAGGRISVEVTGLLPAYRSLLDDEQLIGNQRFFADLLAEHTTSRPPLPVMAQYSAALDQAQSSVLLGSASPRVALRRVYDQVQGAMDQYCPFRLPRAAG